MLFWLFSSAMASQLTLGVPSGSVHTRVTNEIHLAAADDEGVPLDVAPAVFVNGERIAVASQVKSGVWAYVFAGPDEESVLSVRAQNADIRRQWNLQAESVPVTPLSLQSVKAPSRKPEVLMRVEGDNIPPITHLEVAASEGVASLERDEENRLWVRMQLEEKNAARTVLVGIRDTRNDGAPVFGSISVSQQVMMRFEAEAGAVMTVRISGRRYGPFRASEGFVSGIVEQRPGESVAEVRIADDLGNASSARQPLPAQLGGSLVFMPARSFLPNMAPPRIYIGGVEWGGIPVESDGIKCRTPTEGSVKLPALKSGLWVAEFQARRLPAQSIPMACTLGDETFTYRIRAPGGVAHAMRVRVHPDQVSTDFPVADVQVRLEDAFGELLDSGRVAVKAALGQLKEVQGEKTLRMWEYQGEGDAVRAGKDTVEATYVHPLGDGDVVAVLTGHARVPMSGELVLYGRALNAHGLPLSGVKVHMTAGEAAVAVETGSDGWAAGVVRMPTGLGPVLTEIRTPYQVRKEIVFRGSKASVQRPGQSDLSANASVNFRIGRVSSVNLDVEPPILYSGGGAVARLEIRLTDAAGNLVPGEFPILEASEGQFGPLEKKEEGVYTVVYEPTSSDRSRVVQLTARSPSGRSKVVRDLKIEPRPIFRSLGASVGGISNFGRVNSIIGSLDFEQRLGWLSGRVMLRVGVSGWSQTTKLTSSDELTDDYFTRLTLVPLYVGLVGRQEWGMLSGWVGGCGVIGPGVSFERFGQAPGFSRAVFLPPGVMGMSGISYRLNLGELYSEVRGVFLYRPGGLGGLQKQVGGLSIVVGYRFVLD